MFLTSPDGLDQCWDYVSHTTFLARHILSENEHGDLLVPCVSWTKHHKCYLSAFTEQVKYYNRRNPLHWRFKALTVLTRKVVWA